MPKLFRDVADEVSVLLKDVSRLRYKFGSCQHVDGTESQGEMSSPSQRVPMDKRKGGGQG